MTDVSTEPRSNDYEVVVHGLASMLRSYSDRVEVVEVDVNAHPASAVDIALFDTFAQSFRDRARIARLVSDPGIAKVASATGSSSSPLSISIPCGSRTSR